jgi:hypothetical protein
MSGVLERMAKRALGRLPAVQPLIRSIYAAEPINDGKPPPPELLPGTETLERAAVPAAPNRAPSRENEHQRAASQHPSLTPASRLNDVTPHPERQARPVASQAVPPAIPLASQFETLEAPANLEAPVKIDSTDAIIPMGLDGTAPTTGELTPAGGAMPGPVRRGQPTVQSLQRPPPGAQREPRQRRLENRRPRLTFLSAASSCARHLPK